MQTEECDAIKILVVGHIDEIGEETIQSEIRDAMEDYIDWDWELEFDSVEDAYAEQGGRRAEQQVLNEHAVDVLGKDASSEQLTAFMAEMAKQLDITLD